MLKSFYTNREYGRALALIASPWLEIKKEIEKYYV